MKLFRRFFTALVVLLVLALAACPDGDKTDYVYGGTGQAFYAVDFTNGESTYRTDARKVATGEHCTVWLEDGERIPSDYLSLIVWFFDEDIFPLVSGAFSPCTDDNGSLASWVDKDSDGKVALFLLDIPDGYVEGSTGYVGGYFRPGDLDEESRANNKDMLYIDISPGDPSSWGFYGTIAHEFQHLTNYAYTNFALQEAYTQDLWINEGLSTAAEYLFLYPHTNDADWRLLWYDSLYSESSESEIPAGNNFFVWHGLREEEDYSGSALLDNYATAYVFFQWLRIQAATGNPPVFGDEDGRSVYQSIIESGKSDHEALVDCADQINQNLSDWPSILESWYLANIVGDADSLYGYRDAFSVDTYYTGTDDLYMTFTPVMPAFDYSFASGEEGAPKASLYAGEGIRFNGVENFSPGTVPEGIVYLGVADNGNIDRTVPYSGTLLVYNAQTLGVNVSDGGIEQSIAVAIPLEGDVQDAAASVAAPARQLGTPSLPMPRIRRVHPGYGD